MSQPQQDVDTEEIPVPEGPDEELVLLPRPRWEVCAARMLMVFTVTVLVILDQYSGPPQPLVTASRCLAWILFGVLVRVRLLDWVEWIRKNLESR